MKKIALLFGLSLFAGHSYANECKKMDSLARNYWEHYNVLAQKYGCANSKLAPGTSAFTAMVQRCEEHKLNSALIAAGMVKWLRVAGLAGLETRVLRTSAKDGDLFGSDNKGWLYPEVIRLNQYSAELIKTGGQGKAIATFCRFEPGRPGVELTSRPFQNGKDNVGESLETKFNPRNFAIVGALLNGKSATNRFKYTIRLKRDAQGRLRGSNVTDWSKPIKGWADLHVHQMGAFGFHGAGHRPMPFDELVICEGDKTEDCVERKALKDYAALSVNFTRINQMKEAYDNGMRFMVMSAVNNRLLSDFPITSTTPHKPNPHLPTRDMDAAKLQLRAAHFFDQKHDWYQIVTSPDEAKKAIDNGKLAVMLAVEISEFLPAYEGNWKHQLEELYDLGVRMVEVVHERNNDFSGAAIHHIPMMKALQNLQKDTYHTNEKGHSKLGLTEEGLKLVDELVRRKMLIEADHLSSQAREDLFKHLSKKHKYYPIMYSHSRFFELIPDSEDLKRMRPNLYEAKKKQGIRTAEDLGDYMPFEFEVRKVVKTGGVFGLRLGEDIMKAPQTLIPEIGKIPTECQSSSVSIAQMYAYGQYKHSLAMTFGSDLGPVLSYIPPRFGDKACGRTFDKGFDPVGEFGPTSGNPKKLNDFDKHGFINIAFEKHLIDDIETLTKNANNINVEDLRNSARFIIKTWDRAYDEDRKMMTVDSYRKYMGIYSPYSKTAFSQIDGKNSEVADGKYPPACPVGFELEVRSNPKKDRCVKRTQSELKCALLPTDIPRNWTGPHSVAGKDVCRSLKGKKDKSSKCGAGHKHLVLPGKDRCVAEQFTAYECSKGYGKVVLAGADHCKISDSVISTVRTFFDDLFSGN